MVSSTGRGFLAGLLGGGLALALSYALRVTLGAAFLPELASQTLFSLTPGSIESVFVENLQSAAKYSAFTVGILVNLVLYGVVGATLFRSKSIGKESRRLDRLVSFTLVPYLLLAGVGVALIAITAIQTHPVSVPVLLASLAPPQLVFGGVLTWFYPAVPLKPAELCEVVPPPKGKKFDRRRRVFIEAGIASAVGAAILVYGVGYLLRPTVSSGPRVPVSTTTLFAQNVTANSNFYRVDVNIFPPSVASSNWSLKLSGLVNSPQSLSLQQIQEMEAHDQYSTLECVSNTIGGDLVSTAKWRGVKISDLLQVAGAQSSAEYVVFKAVDGYDVAVPMSRAMLEDAILAYEMNGVPLPVDHGYPLRAIVPGLYGMMNCKWITEVELVSAPYQGYWQVRGWTNSAEYQTGSEIVTPGDAQITDRFGISGSSSVTRGPVPVAGIAFAGDRGIMKVEVSTDGGNSWTDASTTEPLSNNTWVFWSSDWNPPTSGPYKLVVRATDGAGTVQTAVMTDPFPNGATGYHVVDVSVS